MKDLAANLLFAVGVVVAVVIWYGYSNNFSGTITPTPEYIPKAVMPPPPPPLLAPNAEMTFLSSSYCKEQQQDLLKKKSHTEIVSARKNDPQKYDIKCFNFPELGDPVAVEKCLVGNKETTAAVGEVIESVMCTAFLKIYQAYVTDFLYPDDVDIKNLPKEVLQRKIQAQLLKQAKNPQLLLQMAQTLIATYPNDFEAIKIYVKAAGFGQKPYVYAEGGHLYPHLGKAYGLNPRDIEIREMYMYAIIHSADGNSKLLKIFPNVKEDPKLQALRYYYLAWAAWNNADRVQALNNLEFAKSLSKNDSRYSEAYDKVKNETTMLKSEGVFNLSFSLI